MLRRHGLPPDVRFFSAFDSESDATKVLRLLLPSWQFFCLEEEEWEKSSLLSVFR
jgi:hypothetical protein